MIESLPTPAEVAKILKIATRSVAGLGITAVIVRRGRKRPRLRYCEADVLEFISTNLKFAGNAGRSSNHGRVPLTVASY